MPEKKLFAVSTYLKAEFPGFEVESRLEPDRKGYVFRLGMDNESHEAVVQEEFLSSHQSEEIPSILERFLLAEHLRDMVGSAVVVTSSGLKMEFDF